MIKKMVRQMLTAQILSAMTVSVCLLIDNVVISRYLGEECMAAYQMANPLLMAVAAVGALLSAGVQVVCSKALGRGSQEEANAGYSSAVGVSLIVSVSAMVLVVLFRDFLSGLLGAGRSEILFRETSGYLMGFSLGAPAAMGAVVLVPFMQMAGQSSLLVAAVLTMMVLDVGLDILNVTVIHGGMFGMGLASSISYYAAVIIAGGYFLSKKCVFRFSWKAVRKETILKLFKNGIPAGVNTIASVILMFLMNQIFAGAGGSAAVAAYGVTSSLGNTACSVTTGVGGVSLTLSGVFFHEEDETSLKALLKLLCRWGAMLGAAMCGVMLLAAPALVSLFLPNEGPTRDMAILGLRLFSVGMIPGCVNAAVKNAWQATGRVTLMEGFSMVEGALLPALAGIALSALIPGTGPWLHFPVGQALALLCLGALVWRMSGRMPWEDGAALLLKKDFGVPENQRLEMDIHNLEEATEAARRAEQFCLAHGQDARTGGHIALCLEEMATNTILHGFSDGKPHHLSVRILKKKDQWILRFRDDCRAFDPVHYVPTEGKEALGIRLVMSMVKEAHYTYSLNLNNLILKL